MKLAEPLYNLLDRRPSSSICATLVDTVILTLIVSNVGAVIFESFDSTAAPYLHVLRAFEAASVVLFTIEYLARLAAAPARYPALPPWRAMLRYIVTPMALVDLAAIVPFYLPLAFRVDLRILRILRVTRLLRILKVTRYAKALRIMGEVLRRMTPELLMTMFVTSLLLLLAASTMYYIENEAQPDAFPNIIGALWWAVATLTTVGYGDVYPITTWGRVVAGAISIIGVGLVALPTGIISAGFLELVHSQEPVTRRPRRKRLARRRHSRPVYRRDPRTPSRVRA